VEAALFLASMTSLLVTFRSGTGNPTRFFMASSSLVSARYEIFAIAQFPQCPQPAGLGCVVCLCLRQFHLSGVGGDTCFLRFPASVCQSRVALRTERTEEPVAPTLGNLDIDHMLPQKWLEHWPLSDGSRATSEELNKVLHSLVPAGERPPKHIAIEAREALVPTMGNLTLLHYGTNRAAQNYAFEKKRALLLIHSNLHLNRQMSLAKSWDESQIQQRAESLYLAACRIWPPLFRLSHKSSNFWQVGR